MKIPATMLMLISLSLAACSRQTDAVQQGPRKVTVTTPQAKSVSIPARYACEIQSQRHITVHAVERGHLEAILVREGQMVEEGDVLCKVQSILHRARRDAEAAETELAQVQLNQMQKQRADKLVPQEEVAAAEARLARARAHL